VKSVLALLAKEQVFSMAHVTGGGFFDNIPRVLPKGCGAKIQTGSWNIPRVFRWIQEAGNTSMNEMYRTFNMGIGFLIVVPKDRAFKVVSHFTKLKERAWVIGDIVKGVGVVIQ
jgi:phosphoribosylformylglycinamidine cyclo-ligase